MQGPARVSALTPIPDIEGTTEGTLATAWQLKQHVLPALLRTGAFGDVANLSAALGHRIIGLPILNLHDAIEMAKRLPSDIATRVLRNSRTASGDRFEDSWILIDRELHSAAQNDHKLFMAMLNALEPLVYNSACFD